MRGYDVLHANRFQQTRKERSTRVHQYPLSKNQIISRRKKKKKKFLYFTFKRQHSRLNENISRTMQFSCPKGKGTFWCGSSHLAPTAKFKPKIACWRVISDKPFVRMLKIGIPISHYSGSLIFMGTDQSEFISDMQMKLYSV